MIINSELFLRTFQIIESGPLPILFILHPYYAKRSHRRKTRPRRDKRQKIPPGETSGGISLFVSAGTTGQKASLPATGILSPATAATRKDYC